MTTPTTLKTFSSLFRQHIDTLPQALGRNTGEAVRVEYGDTDDGQEWALYMVGLEPLATVFAHAGTSGGHIVINAAGECVGSPAGTLDSERLMRTARKEVRAAYRSLMAA